jgi:type II secretory pathway pseudopilin PulG
MSRRGNNRGKGTLLESTLALALMGIVAGAVGGLAIGLVTGSHSSSAAAPSTASPLK